ncbi:MAG: hypothetical protein PHS65_00625 [Arcobacteraceae bacterium]|jgi:hypothetical protein|nr:hypothetical protein [Arcobacteraceae bacterium]
MTTIKIKYLGSKIDTVYNGFFNALGKEALRNEYISKVKNNIKDLEDIEKVIEKITTIEDENNVITLNTVFIITIKSEKYYLTNNFKLISEEEFEMLDFVPYIKFDKSNCDTLKEEQRVNKILKYKNSDEAAQFIQEYIKNVPKYLERISSKPNKIFLYDLNNQQVIEQEFNIFYESSFSNH